MSENFVQMVAPEGVTHDMEHQGYAVIATTLGLKLMKSSSRELTKTTTAKLGCQYQLEFQSCHFALQLPPFVYSGDQPLRILSFVRVASEFFLRVGGEISGLSRKCSRMSGRIALAGKSSRIISGRS